MPSFFSWQLETVLFFLAEKEKNGFKKRFFGRGGNRKKRADRVVRPYGCGGRSEERADRVVRPYGVWRRTQGCTVSVGYCLTAIIKIACGAGRTAKNQSATQRSGCGLERKKEGANMQFSALAGNGMQRVSSDAMAARNAAAFF